jgi:hypothetical protein
MRKHAKHVAAIVACFVLHYLALWQLDLQVAPHEWSNPYIREITPFWFWPNTWSYVLYFAFIMLMPFGVAVAIWYWE